MLRLVANLLIEFDAALDRLPRPLTLLLELFLVACLAFCLYAAAALGSIFFDALSLEMTCPAAPTDIPPYPCTLGEYFLRMTVGGWALIGHVLFFSFVLAVAIGLWIGSKLLLKAIRPRG